MCFYLVQTWWWPNCSKTQPVGLQDQLTDPQHDWDFPAGVKFNSLERCCGVQMQNKSLPWRDLCELVEDSGIYSSQVPSFARGYRYLYSSIQNTGKCPRSCHLPWKLGHALCGGMRRDLKNSANGRKYQPHKNTDLRVSFRGLIPNPSHKGIPVERA